MLSVESEIESYIVRYARGKSRLEPRVNMY